MPRVTNINRQQLLKSDLSSWIRAEMRQQKINQVEMAELLGVTQQNFSYLLARARFTFSQLILIFKRLDADDEKIIKLMKL